MRLQSSPSHHNLIVSRSPYFRPAAQSAAPLAFVLIRNRAFAKPVPHAARVKHKCELNIHRTRIAALVNGSRYLRPYYVNALPYVRRLRNLDMRGLHLHLRDI